MNPNSRKVHLFCKYLVDKDDIGMGGMGGWFLLWLAISPALINILCACALVSTPGGSRANPGWEDMLISSPCIREKIATGEKIATREKIATGR